MPTAAEATLAWWRTEIARLFGGQPTHPVTRALQPFIDGEFGITEARMSAVLDGMQVDLRQNRFLDYAALQRYAHLVAGVVGEMSAGIFGYRDPQTLQYATRLGLALQLINIIRDVGDDARRGRLYLPLDEMQRFNVKASDVLAGALRRRLCAADALSGGTCTRDVPGGAGAAARQRIARRNGPD